MTVAPVIVAAAAVVAIGGGLREVGAAVVLRARAQTAADAAALAAVAESAPGAPGAPVAAAHRLARANGARVLACVCEVGATAMQVEVEVDGVAARARAVIDSAALAPARAGLDPRVAGAVDRILRAGRGRVWVVSGFRDPAQQERLWTDALRTYGSAEVADDWVARPGNSMHEKGLAVDLGGDVEYAALLVDRLGLPLWRPMAWEPWHFELVGSRG
ncbi:MAG TPA: D-alanyl-D-alanine carboxypeptidase family protein [Actinomycetota bacterium]|nr:D-alanyl-D-alanine carboxypeptidase family protein [Actinomycetota bacterium]